MVWVQIVLLPIIIVMINLDETVFGTQTIKLLVSALH